MKLPIQLSKKDLEQAMVDQGIIIRITIDCLVIKVIKAAKTTPNN